MYSWDPTSLTISLSSIFNTSVLALFPLHRNMKWPAPYLCTSTHRPLSLFFLSQIYESSINQLLLSPFCHFPFILHPMVIFLFILTIPVKLFSLRSSRMPYCKTQFWTLSNSPWHLMVLAAPSLKLWTPLRIAMPLSPRSAFSYMAWVLFLFYIQFLGSWSF